jgi:hypothetical protein
METLKNRFFFISYSYSKQYGLGFGNMTFKNDKFPSRSFITEKAAEFLMTVKSNVVILSIQEISCEDFDNYNN